MARQNTSSLPYSLCDYADQLDQIQRSLEAMAVEAGEYNHIVIRMASNVRSTSTVVRAASRVIDSMENHKRHAAGKSERKARAAGAGR